MLVYWTQIGNSEQTVSQHRKCIKSKAVDTVQDLEIDLVSFTHTHPLPLLPQPSSQQAKHIIIVYTEQRRE